MKLNKILKPKSPKEILRTFATNNNIDMYQLEEFLKKYKKDKRIFVWFLAIFIWIFALAMMISAMVAFSDGFFWLPFEPGNNMLTSFINVFWSISWFAVAIFVIIYMIKVLNNLYDN